MNNNVMIQMVSLVYVTILGIVYIIKRKFNFIDSKAYKYLLFSTMALLTLDVLKTGVFVDFTDVTVNILSKLQVALFFVWLLLYVFYTLLSRSNTKYKTFKELLKTYTAVYIWMIVGVVLFSALVILQLMFNYLNINGSDDGLHLVYILGIVMVIIIVLNLLFKNKNVAVYKNFAIMISCLLLVVTIIMQIAYNDYPIIAIGIALITLFQYFTMEEPDLKYIEELEALKAKAEEANQAKTDFLASMSHEIRTPMNAIIGLSENLMNSNVPLEYKEDIKNINEAGNILLEIVNNILDITKVESGKFTLNVAPYSLADMLVKLSTIVKTQLSESTIQFTTEVKGNIPKQLMGDELKVYQVLMNILSNAVKYTKKGTIKFQVESIVSGNKDTLIFKISDTGIGIRNADKNKLFEKFQRLDQERSDIQGSGLGLVITKQLVDLMGGKIKYESVYQQGTTFTVELEQEIANNEAIDYATYETANVGEPEYFDGHDFKILLVDDNLLNLKVAEKLLKKYNFQITSVKSGLECLNFTKHNTYDLIFLDHMMPEMDGIHTLYNMKNRASGFDTPVVVLTANAIDGSKEMYLREGFVDYLSKPIDQRELDRILRKYLNIDSNNKGATNEKENVSSSPVIEENNVAISTQNEPVQEVKSEDENQKEEDGSSVPKIFDI